MRSGGESLGDKGAVVIFSGDEMIGGDTTVTGSDETVDGVNIDGDVGLAGDCDETADGININCDVALAGDSIFCSVGSPSS